MTSQASPDESSIYSDPFKVSPSKSPHPHRHTGAQPSKMQHETMSSLPRRYPVSTRAYNRKDYEYIASFPRVSQAGMEANKGNAELLQHQEMQDKHIDDDDTTSYLQQSHVSLPEFGAWNVEASPPTSEGYTGAFDRVREQKRGVSLPAQSSPAVKELAIAKRQPHTGTHHQKRSSLSWSRCFVAPVTIE